MVEDRTVIFPVEKSISQVAQFALGMNSNRCDNQQYNIFEKGQEEARIIFPCAWAFFFQGV